MLTIQSMCRVFGIEVDLGAKTDEIIAAATPLLSLLAFLGIIVDPTTEGIGDSSQAMTYEEPKPVNRDVNMDGVVNEADIDELLEKIDAMRR
jgi:phi LC3 family holin